MKNANYAYKPLNRYSLPIVRKACRGTSTQSFSLYGKLRLFPLTWCSSASRHLWKEFHYLWVFSSRRQYPGYQASTFLADYQCTPAPQVLSLSCYFANIWQHSGLWQGSYLSLSQLLHSEDQPQGLKLSKETFYHYAACPTFLHYSNSFVVETIFRWVNIVCVMEINNSLFTNLY